MKQKMIMLPVDLLHRVDETAATLGISRSEFVCSAVARYLEVQQQDELRELLKEGYIANAESSLQICAEFAFADYEAMARYLPPYES